MPYQATLTEERKRKWAERLKKFRDKYGLTQAKLAEELNMSERAIQGFEYGKYYPSAKTRILFETVEARFERAGGGDEY